VWNFKFVLTKCMFLEPKYVNPFFFYSTFYMYIVTVLINTKTIFLKPTMVHETNKYTDKKEAELFDNINTRNKRVWYKIKDKRRVEGVIFTCLSVNVKTDKFRKPIAHKIRSDLNLVKSSQKLTSHTRLITQRVPT